MQSLVRAAMIGTRANARVPINGSVDPGRFRTEILKPTLECLGMYSLDSEKLLMGTAAQESHFTNAVQIGGGPARGLFQMEPSTLTDLWHRVINPNSALLRNMRAIVGSNLKGPSGLTEGLVYAAAMCRIKYHSVST